MTNSKYLGLFLLAIAACGGPPAEAPASTAPVVIATTVAAMAPVVPAAADTAAPAPAPSSPARRRPARTPRASAASRSPRPTPIEEIASPLPPAPDSLIGVGYTPAAPFQEPTTTVRYVQETIVSTPIEPNASDTPRRRPCNCGNRNRDTTPPGP